MVLHFLIGIAVWVGLAVPGLAQQDRRDELAKVQEALADPDPMQRLANMEAIVGKGDPVLTQVAIRTAFASDDSALRGLAMRAFLANVREVTFDVVPPPELTRARQAAGGDPSKLRQFRADYPYADRLERENYRLRLRLQHYEFPQSSGTADTSPNYPAPFTIAGSRFSSLMINGYGQCFIDFAPTSKPALEGTMACKGKWPQLAISAVPF